MNAIIATVEPTFDISLANLSNCLLSGVLVSVVSVELRATFPISVSSPTAVTTAVPRPFITMELRRIMFRG